MTPKEFFRIFISVRKCCGCGEILDINHSMGAFCPECKLAWDASLTASCPNCFLPARQCECMPKDLSKAGALCLRRTFFYKSEESREPAMSMIYWLKHYRLTRVVDFVADAISVAVREELDVLGFEEADASRVVACGVPRGRRSRAVYGFDQSALVAETIAKRLGVGYAPLLRSDIKAKKQKDLDRRQRMVNAKAHIRLQKGADVKGKYVVLFDDMVTTGASMSVCVTLLREAGALGVLCFSLASSTKM